MRKHVAIVGRFLFLAFALVDASPGVAGTIKVDCDTGNALGTALANLRPGDVVLLHGTCKENVVIQPEVQRITVDGQRQTTINPPDSNQPAIQVLSREVTIKGLTVTGGTFGIAINRGATAVIDSNTVQNATISGMEVSQNSFGRIVNNTIENCRNGIFVLGSASAHIGVISTGDKVAQPNVVRNNRNDGIVVLRGSDARIIGNVVSGNRRHGLIVQQASHADVAGNTFSGNGENGIVVVGNSGVNLADSAMRVFEQPNSTGEPNGKFGILCAMGAYIEGSIGSLNGSSGAKDETDKSCVDRSAP